MALQSSFGFIIIGALSAVASANTDQAAIVFGHRGENPMSQVSALVVGKWSVGFSKEKNVSILMFEFDDREPINLAIHQDRAIAFARAILDQYSNPPPQPNRMN